MSEAYIVVIKLFALRGRQKDVIIFMETNLPTL